MVRWLLLLAVALHADDVEVTVLVSSERAAEHEPLEAVVSVHHPAGWRLDPESFELEGECLPVNFLHEATQSSLSLVDGRRRERRSIISSYRIELPGQVSGRHLLPPVSVRVSGGSYSSQPTSYFVYGSETSPDYQLFAYVESDKETLFPGERARLVYRLAFRYPIDAAHTDLPLLDAQGFRKVGAKEVRTEHDGGMTIQVISQEVEAIKSGTYTFGASVVEGFPYQKDFFGRPTFEKRRLRAEAPGLTIPVAALPSSGKPSTFDGAVGRFDMTTQLLGPSEMAVGDRLRLQITITGEGSLATLHMPSLTPLSQFRLSDMPPETQQLPGGKQYIVEMRPLSSSTDTIPSLTLAHFDPDSGTYREAHSDPIPLHIVALDRPPLEIAQLEPQPQPRQEAPIKTLGRIKQNHHPLWGLSIFPAGATLLGLQWCLARYRRRPRPTPNPFELARRTQDLARLRQLLQSKQEAAPLIERIDAARFGGASPEGLFDEAEEYFR
jgi:hypothetical protein